MRDHDPVPRPRTSTDRARFRAALPIRAAGAATRAVSLAVIMTLLTACTGETVDPQQQLDARRSGAEAERDNLALLTEVRVALSEVAPGLTWRTDAPVVESGSLCKKPFDGVDGATTQVLQSGGAFGAVPDADWPRAWEAVKKVASARGFGDENVLKDAAGEHQVSLYDKDGTELSVGTGVNTVATVYGACHLER